MVSCLEWWQEKEQLDGSRHVLEEEFREFGVGRCLGWAAEEEEGIKDDSQFSQLS